MDPKDLRKKVDELKARGVVLPQHPAQAARQVQDMMKAASSDELKKDLSGGFRRDRTAFVPGRKVGTVDTSQSLEDLESNSRIMHAMRRQRTASSDASIAIPRFYDPMEYWDLSGLPWNMADEGHRHKLHKWLRLFYATHYLVPILVDIFTRFPLAGMYLSCKDNQLEDWYTELFFNQLNYEDFLVSMGREVWTVGEAFSLGSFDENLGVWEREELINPELVIIENVAPLGNQVMKLVPSESLKHLARTKMPANEYKQLQDNFPEMIPYLMRDEPIPVSDVLMKQIAFRHNDWDAHGTPILLRALRTLIHEEKLLASQDAIAERLYSPLILAKLGAPEMGGDYGPWIPDPGQLEEFRDDLDVALSSDFRVMTYHYALDMQNVFGREQVPDLGGDFDRVERRLMQVFGVNPSLLSGGDNGQPYASSALHAEFMNQILRTFQKYLKDHYRSRALVCAEAQGHYDYEKKGPQPLDAKVLTPTGWTTMGDLKVGDRVVGRDGKPTNVVEVIDQGIQDVYRIEFSDRSSTECAASHNWHVIPHGSRTGKPVVKTIQEILDTGGCVFDSGARKYMIPHVDPVQFVVEEELPLDPYVLGMMLGDGTFGKGNGSLRLAGHIDDILETKEVIEPLLPLAVEASPRMMHSTSPYLVLKLRTTRAEGSYRNPVSSALKQLGLFGLNWDSKFIPEVYLRASVEDRISILQGLMDSDGCTVSRPGGGRDSVFCTSNHQLAKDVVDLIGSLGGSGVLRIRSLRERPNTSQEYVVYLKRLPDWITPHRLTRKANVYNGARADRSGRYRHISKIELVSQKEVRCITVDNDEHLYITDNYIVTHNSSRVKIMEDVVEYDQDGNMRITQKPKLLVPEMEMPVLDVRDEATERAFRMQLRGMGIPIPDDKLMVGVNFEFDDIIDEFAEETMKKTIAQQEVKMKTYRALKDKGLPIPADLKAEIEGMTAQAPPPGGDPGMGGPPPGGGMGDMGGPPPGGGGGTVIAPPMPNDLAGQMGGGPPTATPTSPGPAGARPPVSDEMRGQMPKRP